MPNFVRRWLRPRGLILTVMIVAVGAMIWRSQRVQREADAARAADWVRSTVVAAQADRGGAFVLAGTEPLVAGVLAAWVRSVVPEGRAVEPRVTAVPVGGGPFGAGDGEATHRATVDLLGSRGEADVHWAGGRGAITAWRALAPRR
jgi:hypothetical protein